MSHIPDRYLWLGLGVFTVLATKYIASSLSTINSLTVVSHPTPPPTSLPEDAIKLDSLRTLATCPNTEIRKAATKILLERFIAHPTAYKGLISDVHASDKRRRRRAVLAFGLLEEFGYVEGAYGVPPPLGGRGAGARWLRGGGSGSWGDGGSWGGAGGGWTAQGARDRRSSDPMERELRRRRREAMVIHEGDQPLSGGDVWMRDGEGRMGTDGAVGVRENDEEAAEVWA